MTRPPDGLSGTNAPLQQMKADVFKAMGNPMRIRVLELLCEREHSVGEMLSQLGVGASALSQQLGVLRGAGLVLARREASAVYYSVTSPRIADLLAVGRQLRADLLSLQVEMLSDLQAEEGPEAPGKNGNDDASAPPSDHRSA